MSIKLNPNCHHIDVMPKKFYVKVNLTTLDLVTFLRHFPHCTCLKAVKFM